MPRVSVIIPTHNTAQYIGEAVESVLNQTCKDFEIVVVDDGSTDGTRDVLAFYENRIRYVWQENQERAVARNHGIELATGEFVAFIDADDVWLPDKLEFQVSVLERYPQAVLTYGPARIIDDTGKPAHFWGSQYLCGQPGGKIEVQCPGPEMLFGSPIMPSVVMVRHHVLDQAGLFDPRTVPAEDWEMWLRLAQCGSFIRLPQVLCNYRTTGSERELRRRISDQTLANSAYVIQKSAAAFPDKFPQELRDRALASVHMDSALASYELGDTERGQKVMSQAIRLDPNLSRSLQFTFRLEAHARRILWEAADETKAMEFLKRTIANLPPGVQLPSHGVHGVMSRVYMANAFRANSSGETKAMRQVWSGVRHDPSWLSNRGVWVVLAKSLFSSNSQGMQGNAES